MSLTKNEERLLQWASAHKKPCREQDEIKSFWVERKTTRDVIMEYGPETLNEMQDYLQNAEAESMFSLIVSAEAMKEKMRYYKEKEETIDIKVSEEPINGNIPDYVYLF